MNAPPSRRLAAGLVAVALIAAVAFLAHRGALRAELSRLREAAGHRLDMVATALDGDLARLDYLPSLLETTPAVTRLLDRPTDPAARDAANRTLRGINASVGAEMIYVLDRAGVSLAAADADTPDTTVGRDLSFRPYVQDALEHRRGRFYGVGITSGRPGYYLSYALGASDRPAGVAVVKASLEDAQRSWRQLPGEVLLADERGVVILASREGWRFRPLAPLAPDVRAEIDRARPYGGTTLVPLGGLAGDPPGGRTGIEPVTVEGRRMLASVRLVNGGRWRLLVLDDVAPASTVARNAAVTAALAAAVLGLTAVAGWQRRRAVHQQLASRAALQAAHDGLETKVGERTAELRAAQEELLHAGRLAAFGQLAAGIVHEVNQPLAALRTLSDNAVRLLEQRRDDDVRANLQRIGKLVDRLGRLTQQLKVFARKSDAPSMPVPIRRAVEQAQWQVAHRLRDEGATLDVAVEPPTLAALADEAGLEQVLVNLFGNALDAMEQAASPVRRIEVQASTRDGRCIVTVTDSGPGIRDDMLPRLFEPFASSKPAGLGLGLGLVISANLVRERGGTLRGANRDGGACFTLDLPRADVLGAAHGAVAAAAPAAAPAPVEVPAPAMPVPAAAPAPAVSAARVTPVPSAAPAPSAPPAAPGPAGALPP